MRKITALSALFLIGTLALGSCSLYGTDSTSDSPAAPPAANSTNQAPAPVSSALAAKAPAVKSGAAVNIQDFAFIPSSLTVKTGATVTWTNNDSAPHKVKSNILNSKMLGKGESFSFTFNETGIFDYICQPHPFMTGKIIVK